MGGPDPGSMSGLSVFVSSGAGGVCCRDRSDYPVMGASFSMACLDHVGPVWHPGCDHDGPFYQEQRMEGNPLTAAVFVFAAACKLWTGNLEGTDLYAVFQAASQRMSLCRASKGVFGK